VKEFSERYYQTRMAEQLLMGAAAGMAHEIVPGKSVFFSVGRTLQLLVFIDA
jgi:transketolase